MPVKRFFVLLGVAALVTLVLAPAAGATVHHLMSGECSAPPAGGTVADTQDPPGISDPTSDNFAQPLMAVVGAGAMEFTDFELIEVAPGVFEFVPVDAEGPAANGDNGDQHCRFPETSSHADDSDDTGTDADFPGQGG